ncbi:MAG: biotin-dependent carboxyltransferase family protein [Devosia sp.]
MTTITILRAGPLTTLQDAGRFGMLRHGISASGPMDRGAFGAAGAALPLAGSTGIEFTQGLAFETDGPLTVASPEVRELKAGDRVELPPAAGNYGYVRFDREVDVAPVLGSRSTNVTVGLGGYKGRALKAGDRIAFGEEGRPELPPKRSPGEGPLRVIWGIHADLFDARLRQRFAEAVFRVTASLDRMGVKLEDPAELFRDQQKLGLVSDAIVPGDVQILGDGTPIVLMRDHQPTGGYPRIATIVSADLDRFAQMRPGTDVTFLPVRA